MKTKLVNIVENYMKVLESIENDSSISTEEKTALKTKTLEMADRDILDFFTRAEQLKCPELSN